MTKNDQELVKKMGEGFLKFSKAFDEDGPEQAVAIMEDCFNLLSTADDRQAVLLAHMAQRDELCAKVVQQQIGRTLN